MGEEFRNTISKFEEVSKAVGEVMPEIASFLKEHGKSYGESFTAYRKFTDSE